MLAATPEKLGAVAPIDPALVHQAEVGLVHQGGGLESMAGGFPAQVGRCKTMQLLVQHREHLVEPPLVVPAPVEQPLRDGALGGAESSVMGLGVGSPAGTGDEGLYG